MVSFLCFVAHHSISIPPSQEPWLTRGTERVDQLCINQDDDEDKAQQVPHMRTIYEKAACTAIWLRPTIKDGRLAMDLIVRLYDLSKRPNSGSLLHQLPLSEILGPSTEDNLRSWHALADFMSHTYWTRTWILPEATARVDMCVVVGAELNRALDIRYVFWIRNVLKYLWTRKPPPEFLLDDIPSSLVGRVENFWLLQKSTRAKTVTLFDLLAISRRTECSRPEDKIFSMLPFAADVGDYTNDKYLKPSYTNGCDCTYADLIKWYIMKYRNCKSKCHSMAAPSSLPHTAWVVAELTLILTQWISLDLAPRVRTGQHRYQASNYLPGTRTGPTVRSSSPWPETAILRLLLKLELPYTAPVVHFHTRSRLSSHHMSMLIRPHCSSPDSVLPSSTRSSNLPLMVGFGSQKCKSHGSMNSMTVQITC